MKNFILKIKAVNDREKGLINLVDYLENEEHDNHNDKHKILNISNNKETFLKKTLQKHFIYKTKRTLEKKRGKQFTSYARSFMFSLPPETKLSDNDYKIVVKNVLKDLEEFLIKDLSIDAKNQKKFRTELLNSVFINYHLKENGSDHLNLIIANIIGSKKLDLGKYKYKTLLQNSFTQHVFKLNPDAFINLQRTQRRKPSEKYITRYKNNSDFKIYKRFFNYLNRYLSNQTQKNFKQLQNTKEKLIKTMKNEEEKKLFNEDLEHISETYGFEL